MAEDVSDSDATRPAPQGPGGSLVGPVGIILLLVYLVAMSLVLVYGLVVFWPLPPPAEGQGRAPSLFPAFDWAVSVNPEVRLLLMVALSGALGGLVHALRSVYWYVGNRSLVRSWLAMYVLLPLVGATLAVVFYLVIRGGFFSPQATVQETSPFGFAALAVLVGMFSTQAALKLKQVAGTVFAEPEAGRDPAPAEGQSTLGDRGRERRSE